MAEYIKREDMLALIQEEDYCDCAGQVCYSVGNSELIAIPTADVVERSEYDKLKTDLQLMINCGTELNDSYNHMIVQYKDLRFNIDKAIEEIKHCKVYGKTEIARLVSLPDVLEILKRNLGE